jgi:hypothetical protein
VKLKVYIQVFLLPGNAGQLIILTEYHYGVEAIK